MFPPNTEIFGQILIGLGRGSCGLIILGHFAVMECKQFHFKPIFMVFSRGSDLRGTNVRPSVSQSVCQQYVEIEV